MSTAQQVPSTAPPSPPVAPPPRAFPFWQARVGGLPRPFYVLLLGQFVNRLGGFVEPFLALYLVEVRGLSLGAAGVVLALHGAGGIASQLIGGILADRFGRRRTLMLSMGAAAVTLFGLGMADGVLALALFAVLAGLGLDMYRPASGALVADIVPAPERPRAYGLLFWVANLGFSGAAVLAGLAASHGYTLLFTVDALTCVACGVAIWLGVPETLPPRRRDGRRGPGIGVVLRDRVFLGVVGAAVLFACVFFQAYLTLPLVMRADRLSPATYGAVIALNGLTVIVVQPLVVNRLTRLDRSLVLATSQLLLGAGFGMFLFVDSAVGYGAVVVLWTIGEIGNASVAQALVSDLAPPQLRGRYMGVFGMAFGVAALAAPILGTAALNSVGEPLLWGGCAAAGVAMAVIHLTLRPAVRSRAASLTASRAR